MKNPFLIRISSVALVLFLADSPAFAASAAWDGGSGLWISGNWNPSTPGSSGNGQTNTNTATFNVATSGTITLGPAKINIEKITFDGSTGSFTFNAQNPGALALTSGGTIQIASTVTSTGQVETFNAPVQLYGNATFANNQTGTDILSFGAVSNNSFGTPTLTLTGTNTGANTISGIITGGSLVKSGPGTWILTGGNNITGGNNYTGGTTINAGTLQVGNGGGSGQLGTGGVIDNGNLVYNGVTGEESNAISGSGTVMFTNNSFIILTGTNTYSGGTTISVDSLLGVGDGTTGQLGTGGVTNNGQVIYDRSNTLSDGNTISGVGVVDIEGGGTINLTATNSSYIGATAIFAGVLNAASLANGGSNSSIGASSNVATNLIFAGGTLQYTGSVAQSTDRLFYLEASAAIDSSGTGTLSFTSTGSILVAASTAPTVTLTGSNTGANTFAPMIGDGSGGGTNLIKSGNGTWTLTGASTYTGGTTVASGTLYVNNTSGSGTGTGGVTVNSGGTLAGSGRIAPTSGTGVTVNSGGTLYSGGVASGTPATGPGTGMTLNNSAGLTTILSVSGDAPANLTFTLGSGNSGLVGGNAGYHTFSNPNNNTTYMTVVAGNSNPIIDFSGPVSVTLVDLTNGGLSLRMGTPYLLIQAYSTALGVNQLGDDALYSGLVTSPTDNINNLALDGNGYVMGVGTLSNYTPISIIELGSDGVSPLTGGNIYGDAQLYLYNGDLEVVPEPGAWALLLGGLGLLAFWRKRTPPSLV